LVGSNNTVGARSTDVQVRPPHHPSDRALSCKEKPKQFLSPQRLRITERWRASPRPPRPLLYPPLHHRSRRQRRPRQGRQHPHLARRRKAMQRMEGSITRAGDRCGRFCGDPTANRKAHHTLISGVAWTRWRSRR